jgi:DNA-binding NtrC family response regulator
VLDFLVERLRARFVLFFGLEGGPEAPAIARCPSRRPVARPERLLRIEPVRRTIVDARPVFIADGASWAFGRPIGEAGGLRAAIVARGTGPAGGTDGEHLAALFARAAPWVALAWEISVLRRLSPSPLGPVPSPLLPPEGTVPSPLLPPEGTVPSPLFPPEGTLSGTAVPSPPSNGAGPESRRPALPLHGAGSMGRALVRDAAPISAPAPVAPPAAGDFPELIAFAPAMREILRTVALVAPSDAGVLIEGESGTGKELIARAIHRNSLRSDKVFVSENCAACPEGLLESEFFGVERGAFTGASCSKPGLFERADGGTLFLDEIGEMDLSLQRKLLRALQEREVRRVGGRSTIPVDFRLVSATSRVLSEEAREGRFRPDLLYRIDVVTVRLPPLRDRAEDIPLLVRHFLLRHSRSAGRPPPAVDPAALRLLCEYEWPGNVRELENEMWRSVALGIETITPDVLSSKIVPSGRPLLSFDDQLLLAGRSLDEIERQCIGGLVREAMRRTKGNKIQAALLLKIPRANLYRRLIRYGLLKRKEKKKPPADP